MLGLQLLNSYEDERAMYMYTCWSKDRRIQDAVSLDAMQARLHHRIALPLFLHHETSKACQETPDSICRYLRQALNTKYVCFSAGYHGHTNS